MKQKNNSNPNPKSKTFLGKWGEGWSFYGALECISSDMHFSASRALDTAIVVIDRMTDADRDDEGEGSTRRLRSSPASHPQLADNR